MAISHNLAHVCGNTERVFMKLLPEM